MYRLVLIALMVVAAAAVLLSLVGQLAFPVTDLLATGAVAVAASFASSWLFALVFRTKAHPESSLITGFLLFFLFYPSTALSDLSSVALAAAIASASKYLFAIRARHIFNPAAIGAFVVSLLGLNFAVWWVATGLLLPLTAIGALLVLYRSRRLPVGLTFVTIAAVLVTVRLVSSGQDVGDAVVSAFTQFPIVFLAGFMLSEPLTLPPRRWQQLTVAAVVAVVFSTVFSLGPITNTPELALLVGNVVAFAFGQRRGIRLTYLGKRRLTPSSWELSFQPAGAVRFTPGQYLELSVPHRADFRGSRRIFSISSAPTTDGPLTVALSVPDRPSSFKRAFLALEPGARVMATGIGGDFLLPRDKATPVVLLAGGIGITPFASQLAHDHEAGHDRDVVVVYAVRDNAELGYADLLEKSRVPVVLVSPEHPDDLPENWVWAGVGRITPDLLRAAVPDLAARRAFVSGPPGMVADLRAALKKIGVRKVSADYFSGY
ncbi:ferredoxin--NADP reductase [Conyzicola sp.]|uniref:ferredoxin--NADP reductase n=1 Tax=Conyzicola sp. TaxID=1969404 RepID=UPI003989FAD6